MRNNNRRTTRSNNQQNRNRRNQGYRGRGAGRFDHDENDTQITPQQRRHAANQQNKFLDLAKNARQSGERVETEYYMQHVEHYTRIIALADEQYKEREEARRKSKDDEAEESADTQEDVAEEDNEAVEEPAEEQDDAPVKKRAPRKPRTSLKEKESAEEQDDAASEEKPKTRRRARPKKADASEDSGANLQHVLPMAKDFEE